jgi:hypothetical protein
VALRENPHAESVGARMARLPRKTIGEDYALHLTVHMK